MKLQGSHILRSPKKMDEVFVDFHGSDFLVNIDDEKIDWRLKVTVII